MLVAIIVPMATDEEQLAKEWEELARMQKEFDEQKIKDRTVKHKTEIELKKKEEEEVLRHKMAEEEKVWLILPLDHFLRN